MMNKKKLILIRIIVIILSVLAVLWLFSFVLEKAVQHQSSGDDDTEITRKFYEPSPGEDILNDKEYLEKNSDITYYDEYGNGYLITDGNYLGRGGLALELMSHFFDAVKNGSDAKLNVMFAPEYYEENGQFEPFNPQRIYDISVTFEGSETDEDTGNITTVFTVSYKIMKNDGTFRTDIGSDTSRKQYFTILETEDDIVIKDITFVKRILLFTDKEISI